MDILEKLWNASKWSIAGLVGAFKNELAFRLELVAAVILTPLAFYIAEDLNQLLWLIFSVYLVLIVELLNSGIEAAIDRIGQELHQMSKYAKDVGSAAVFCTVLLATMMCLIIIGFNQYS